MSWKTKRAPTILYVDAENTLLYCSSWCAREAQSEARPVHVGDVEDQFPITLPAHCAECQDEIEKPVWHRLAVTFGDETQRVLYVEDGDTWLIEYELKSLARRVQSPVKGHQITGQVSRVGLKEQIELNFPDDWEQRLALVGQVPMPGDLVRIFGYWEVPDGTLGVIDGLIGRPDDEMLVIFRPSGAFRGGGGFKFSPSVVASASGGPGLYAPKEALEPTGEMHEFWFWRWREWAEGDGGMDYKLAVPVWDWRRER